MFTSFIGHGSRSIPLSQFKLRVGAVVGSVQGERQGARKTGGRGSPGLDEAQPDLHRLVIVILGGVGRLHVGKIESDGRAPGSGTGVGDGDGGDDSSPTAYSVLSSDSSDTRSGGLPETPPPSSAELDSGRERLRLADAIFRWLGGEIVGRDALCASGGGAQRESE